VVEISGKRHGLGSEHPLCDRIQLIMLVLFLVVWGIDSLSFFIFGYSTVLVDVISFPALVLPSFVSLGFGLYLVASYVSWNLTVLLSILLCQSISAFARDFGFILHLLQQNDNL
jgi:hypothetical protein